MKSVCVCIYVYVCAYIYIDRYIYTHTPIDFLFFAYIPGIQLSTFDHRFRHHLISIYFFYRIKETTSQIPKSSKPPTNPSHTATAIKRAPTPESPATTLLYQNSGRATVHSGRTRSGGALPPRCVPKRRSPWRRRVDDGVGRRRRRKVLWPPHAPPLRFR